MISTIVSPRSLKNLAESLYNTALLATTSNRSRIIEIGPPTTLLLSTITMSTGNEDVTDPQDTSTAAVCRALTISPDEDGTYSEENECDCPRCEPANDAFIPRSDIDPHRRIVRARRPPQAASSSSSTAAAPFGSEGNFISNASTTTTSESAVHAQNLSSAINILHQLNNNNNINSGRPSRGAAAVQQVVSDSDDESMPPLEDIDGILLSSDAKIDENDKEGGTSASMEGKMDASSSVVAKSEECKQEEDSSLAHDKANELCVECKESEQSEQPSNLGKSTTPIVTCEKCNTDFWYFHSTYFRTIKNCHRIIYI